MTSLALILWLANITVDTGGQLAFKAAACDDDSLSGWHYWQFMLRRPWLWLGILFYIAEFFVWLSFLSQVELSAGVMLGSINIVILMLAGHYLFQEKLTRWRVSGILLITLGVAVVGWGQT